MPVEYEDVNDLRKIAKEAGIKRVNSKKEDTLLDELQSLEPTDEKPEQPPEDTPTVEETVEASVEKDEPEVEKVDPPKPEVEKPTPNRIAKDYTEDEVKARKLEKLISRKNKELEASRQKTSRLEIELREMSLGREATTQKSFLKCVKESHAAAQDSDAVAKAQERASMKRAVMKSVKRRMQ